MLSISIIIPAYNVERYLGQCLDSVFHQGLDDFEVILVDDGATDGSPQICDEYAARYPQIRVVHQENKGLSGARNTGINHAKGQYVYFVDADDFLVPGSLCKVVDTALQNDADVVCFGSINGTRQKLMEKSERVNNASIKSSDILNGDDYITSHNFLATVWWYFIKREYLQSLGLTFPVGHCLEDGSFTPFILLHAKRIIHVETMVYCYVIQLGSIMHNKDRNRNFNMLSDYAFAARNLVDEHERCGEAMSETTSNRWMGLANSYIFFGLLKALRLGESHYMIKHLKSLRLYPFEKLYVVDYPEKKWAVLHWLMSHELIWRLLSLPFKIIKL